MGKGKRSRKRKKTMPRRGVQARQTTRDAAAPTLQVLAGGQALETRPEYQAHMQAWREAGCPPG